MTVEPDIVGGEGGRFGRLDNTVGHLEVDLVGLDRPGVVAQRDVVSGGRHDTEVVAGLAQVEGVVRATAIAHHQWCRRLRGLHHRARDGRWVAVPDGHLEITRALT